MAKRGRPRIIKPSIKRDQYNGWINTDLGSIYLPNVTQFTLREDLPKEGWNFAKSALSQGAMHIDLTNKKYARGILQLNKYVIVIV
jgi:hypothetical protein